MKCQKLVFKLGVSKVGFKIRDIKS